MNRLFLFLILSFAVLLFDLYAYQGLKVVINGFPGITQRIIKVIFWGLTVITLLSFILYEPLSSHDKGRKVLMIIATIGVANILGKLLFAIWLLIDDAFRGIQWVWKKLNPPIKDTNSGISRNEFLAGIGAISATIPVLTMTWGVVSGAHDYTIRRRKLNIANLPANFEGYKILQISDIHCGSFWNRTAVKRGVEMFNAEAADAVFFTGDIVNNKASELEDWTDVFSKIKSKDGVFSVLGNHDYGDYVKWDSKDEKANNLKKLIDLQIEMGFKVLLNDSEKIYIDKSSIDLIGVENWGGGFKQNGDLDLALQKTNSDSFKILMSHDPTHWEEKVISHKEHIDLTLAGHTHGMQFGIEIPGFIKWSPIKYRYKYWAGIYKELEQIINVNRGFGFLAYPGRVGIYPEITLITLKDKESLKSV